MAQTSLKELLLLISPEEFQEFLALHESHLIRSHRPFTDYMRAKFREKGIKQKNVFIAADLDDRLGYKLISGEKRTEKRDVIIRICLAAEFRLAEVQEALTLYGMSPLHERIPRDMAFIVSFNCHIYDIHDVDTILRENNLPPFLTPDPPI